MRPTAAPARTPKASVGTRVTATCNGNTAVLVEAAATASTLFKNNGNIEQFSGHFPGRVLIMATITINDLHKNRALDHKAMAAIKGAIGAPWVYGWIRAFVQQSPSF